MAGTCRTGSFLLLSALVATLGCGDSKKSGKPTPTDMSSAGEGGDDAFSPFGGTSSAGSLAVGGTTGGSSGGTTPVEEPWVDPYPRTWADREFTRPLATGEITLVGGPESACSNQVPSAGDRWCAFARGPAAGPVSLWVVNVTAVAERGAPACDEESESCLKLTDALWTGEDLWGPSHPRVQRFDGDTLIFYADAEEPVREPYSGPIYAWRPGWSSAQQLTNAEGVVCTGHRRVPAMYCVKALDVDQRMAGDFGPPIWHSFDLMAGLLGDAPNSLTLVERITVPLEQQSAFSAQFDRAGKVLAYSSVTTGAERESLRYVSLDQLGTTPPTAVLDNASEWLLSHDGNAVYALRNYDRKAFLGELVVADFPSGQNVSAIATAVAHIDPVGEFDAPLNDQDRGVGYDVETELGYAFDFLQNRANPETAQRIGDGVMGPKLSPLGTHTLIFQDAGQNWPLAKVVDHATGKACTLNQQLSAETYNGRFTADGSRAIWVEYGNTGSEVGYAANHDCSDAVKFGDWVLGYQVQGDFVIFEGGDDMDSTSYLEYARLPTTPGAGTVSPLHVYENPSYPIASFALEDKSYFVFSGVVGSPAAPGLYLHGPLEAAIP